jgi:hypothetical protein
MTAPVCPINEGQVPFRHKFLRDFGQNNNSGPLFSGIPNATDLPSLILATNVMRDILRSLTTSLSVNNVWNPRPPSFKSKPDTNYSQYPVWNQKDIEAEKGFIYHKLGRGQWDKTQRVWVQRTHAVTFENATQDDKPFIWRYVKPLDSIGTEPLFPTGSFTGG